MRKKQKSLSVSPSLPWRDLILAGGFTGLAWWTKYNGWLPIAIGMAGAMLWLMNLPHRDRQIQRILQCGFVIGLIAFVTWSPVLWGLQSQGGYAGVAANHRGYVVGLSGWGDSAIQQIEHVGLYENWIGMFTEPFGASEREIHELNHYTHWPDVVYRLIQSGGGRKGLKLFALKLTVLVNRIASYLIPVLLLIVVCVALRNRLDIARLPRDRISVCLLAAWVGGMTAATPFYHPYPRLALPWLMAIWLGIGLAAQIWRDRSESRHEFPAIPTVKLWIPSRVEWLLVVWVIANCSVRSVQGTAHALRDRTSIEVAATNIAKTIKENVGSRGFTNDRAVVFVYGEPAMVFGLRANGMKFVAAIANFEFALKPLPLQKNSPPLQRYLVYGRQALDRPAIPSFLSKLTPCPFPYQHAIHPSHLVEMDSQSRNLASDFSVWPTISLFRIQE